MSDQRAVTEDQLRLTTAGAKPSNVMMPCPAARRPA